MNSRRKASPRIELTSPDRIVFPEQGLTKAELAEYYEKVAKHLLEHDGERPLTVVRCPSGREGKCFFQKHANASVPDALPRVNISETDKSEPYLYLKNESDLRYLVQLNVLEIHVWNSKVSNLERPDRIVVDLDPDVELDSDEVVSAAFLLKDAVEHLGLAAFVGMTGGKGLHVVIPIRPSKSWNDVKAFTSALCKIVARSDPERFVTVATKQKRTGKIYLDYLRNGRGATAIANYSTRARPGAPVAVPLRWDEVSHHFGKTTYTVKNITRRLGSLKEDPWVGYFGSERALSDQMLRAVGL